MIINLCLKLWDFISENALLYTKNVQNFKGLSVHLDTHQLAYTFILSLDNDDVILCAWKRVGREK